MFIAALLIAPRSGESFAGSISDASNVAKGRPTSVSTSQGFWGDTTGSLAVDGEPNPSFKGGKSCTSTKITGGGPFDNPWWKVDLQKTRSVSHVRITNRGDCCGANLDGFTIKVGGQTCGQGVNVVPQGLTGDFQCNPPLSGDNVEIKITGKGRTLILCEVSLLRGQLLGVRSDTDCSTVVTG